MSEPEKQLSILMFRCTATAVDALAGAAQVHVAENAEAALDVLRRHRIDAAVVDNVGFGDGAAFLKTLRDPAQTPAPGLPVIGVIGEARPDQIQYLVRRGIDQVIVKPFSAVTVTQLVGQLKRQGTEQARTDTYIGPDRRRVSLGDHSGPERRGE
jgi:two-component system chemotaxis response regulator CheY